MVLKLFSKTTGKEVKKTDLVYGYGYYITNNDKFVTFNNRGNVKRVHINTMPKYEIRYVPETVNELVEAGALPAYRTAPIFLHIPANPGEPTRVLMTADELRVNVPDGVKPFEFKEDTVTPNPKSFTPLANAIMYLVDEGYSVKGVRDHDRTGFRSIQAKKKDKTTLIAHIEIIDGLRYVRNSIFNMIKGE